MPHEPPSSYPRANEKACIWTDSIDSFRLLHGRVARQRRVLLQGQRLRMSRLDLHACHFHQPKAGKTDCDEATYIPFTRGKDGRFTVSNNSRLPGCEKKKKKSHPRNKQPRAAQKAHRRPARVISKVQELTHTYTQNKEQEDQRKNRVALRKHIKDEKNNTNTRRKLKTLKKTQKNK